MDTFADQRIERRAQGQRQVVAETEVRQDQRDDGVDRPGVQAPVEEGELHRLLGRGHRIGVAHGRVGVVHQGLGDTEEHQADAHAGGEQHGEPGAVAIVGLAVVGAELDVAEAAYGQEDHGDEDQRHAEDVEPAGVQQDPGLDLAEQRLGLVAGEGAVEHQGDDEQCGAVEDRRVEGGLRRLICLH
ncbi:hypothetical protein D3C81_1597590 [compost metagenome]